MTDTKTIPQDPVRAALARMIDECERANEMCVREIGMGVFDMNAISTARTALAAGAAQGGVPSEMLKECNRLTDALAEAIARDIMFHCPAVVENARSELDDAIAALASSQAVVPSEPTPERLLRAVIAHWNEFGPEHGFGETIDRASQALGDEWLEAPAEPTEDALWAMRRFVSLEPAGDECRVRFKVGVQSFTIGTETMDEPEAAQFAALFVHALAVAATPPAVAPAERTGWLSEARITELWHEWCAGKRSTIHGFARLIEREARHSDCTLSWSGFNVYGDQASIAAVKDALHAAGTVPELKALIRASAGPDAALIAARDWIEEAVSYTGCETWSPSLTEQGNELLFKLRALARQASAAAPAPEPFAWHGLTEGEREQAVSALVEYGTGFVAPLYAVIEGVERKLMERNTQAAPPAPDVRALPPGWVAVPMEPTDEMETAAENSFEQMHTHFPDWKAAYRAMLTALPAEAPDVRAAEVAGEPQDKGHQAVPVPVGAAHCERWQPIETAPKDGTDILLSNGVRVTAGNWLHAEGGIIEHRDMEGRYVGQDESEGYDGWIDWSGGMLPEPTHWMSLPAAPKPEAT